MTCLVLWTLYVLSRDARELEKWPGQAPSLLGSLSNEKTGPRGTVWDSRNRLEDTPQTERWLWCHKEVVEKNDLGREKELSQPNGWKICSHQEMIIMFQRHRNQLHFIKYCASLSRHANKNLILITCFFLTDISMSTRE